MVKKASQDPTKNHRNFVMNTPKRFPKFQHLTKINRCTNHALSQNTKQAGTYLLKVTCSNMFRFNSKDTRTTPLVSFWCLYC